jgi:hypothetical protein
LEKHRTCFNLLLLRDGHLRRGERGEPVKPDRRCQATPATKTCRRGPRLRSAIFSLQTGASGHSSPCLAPGT